MSTIQIRNVPDDVHRQLKVRAAATGRSLSDYLLDELLDLATRPTLAEWAAEVEKLDLRTSGLSAADILAEERRRDDPPRR